MKNEFNTWLTNELKRREWKPADLAHRAGLGSGSLSNILSGNRRPGPDICVAIATAMGEDPVNVFRQAGLLPDAAENNLGDLTYDEVELVGTYRHIPPTGP